MPHRIFRFPIWGWAYYNQKKYDLSVKYYQEALKLEPRFQSAIRGLGRTYQAQGKLIEAIAVLEEGVKQFPRSPELYSELGAAYTAFKKYPAAAAAYARVIELSQASSPLAKDAQKSLDALKDKRRRDCTEIRDLQLKSDGMVYVLKLIFSYQRQCRYVSGKANEYLSMHWISGSRGCCRT